MSRKLCKIEMLLLQATNGKRYTTYLSLVAAIAMTLSVLEGQAISNVILFVFVAHHVVPLCLQGFLSSCS